VVLPFTRLGDYLGFTTLPHAYWGFLGLTLLGYLLLTQAVKALLLRQRWI
jgi:Mg2+-importing ATPase